MKVYKAISEVMHKLSKEGIGKSRKNAQQGYNFRGIDDMYNELSPMLSAAGLCILPNATERIVVERESKSGAALFYVTVKVEFRFVCAEDDSHTFVTTYGEAMDSGDKATNKAMSAAFKYACMQAFCIPTEGDNDADSTTHEVKPSAKHSPADGALKSLSAQDQETAKSTAAEIVDLFAKGNGLTGYELFYQSNLDNEMKLAIWELLKPNTLVRSELKKMHKGNE